MLEAPAVFASVSDLIAGATERTSLTEGAGKSGARLERVVIGGQPYVLKHLDLAQDWTMRASGCLRGAPLLAWERRGGSGGRRRPGAIGRVCPAHAGRVALAGPGD
jgi:hypothetical protein